MSKSFVTPWTVAHQAHLFMGLPKQEYWIELPPPSPWDLPEPGIEPPFPELVGGFFTTEPSVKLLIYTDKYINRFSYMYAYLLRELGGKTYTHGNENI